MRAKPEVGQILYSLNRGVEQKLTPVEVVKVGRKYFTCRPQGGDRWSESQYYIDGWREKVDYSPSCLYLTPQEWEDEKESREICRSLAKVFEWGRNKKNLSLETLKKIKALVEQEKK